MKLKHWSRPSYIALAILVVAAFCISLLPMPFQSPFGAGVARADTYTKDTAETYYWICPAGVTSVQVECWGAGAGGQGSGDLNGGAGGGGGEYAKTNSVAVTPGGNYTVVVGAGGPANTAGGQSSFNATSCIAKGGTISTGGTGGTGDTKYNGGNGGAGGFLLDGGGGEGAGTDSNGHNGTSALPGIGGSGGDGGNGGNGATGGVAQNGVAPGGGGGGGLNGSTTGVGAAGKVVLTFTVAADPPTININAATNILDISATLNGNVSATGGSNPTIIVYWGDNDGGEVAGNWDNNAAPTSPSQPQGAVAFYYNATGLSPSTLYYFNAKGNNTNGTSWGTSGNFTTEATPLEIETLPATNIEPTSVTLNGNITVSGSVGNCTHVHFVYGTTSQDAPAGAPPGDYDDSWTSPAGSYGAGVFNSGSGISGLPSATVIYFRAGGNNTDGYTYGDEMSCILGAENWYSDYLYRKLIPISGSTGAGANYQRSLEIHSGAGTDSAGIVYLNDHSLDFPTVTNTSYDIQLTDNDGNTTLSQWIEEVYIGYAVPGDRVAETWFKVTDSLEADVVVCLYYGKAVGDAVSSDSDTFITGVDFDDGTTTDLTVNLTGGNAYSTVQNPTELFSTLKVDYFHKMYNNPALTIGSSGAWDDRGVRDLSPVLYGNNTWKRDSTGALEAYYGGSNSTAVLGIGKAISSDGGKTFTKYGSNPILAESSCATMYLPSTAPDTNKPYKMLAMSGADLNLYESVDGITFSAYASNPVLAVAASFDHISGGNVPWVIKSSSGNYTFVFETLTVAGHALGAGKWIVCGATSGNLTTWTPMNSGREIISLGAGGTWDTNGIANPKLIELVGVDAGKFIMSYNGDVNSWEVGFATTTDNPANWTQASWTKYTGNSVIQPNGSYTANYDFAHTECSAMTIDDIIAGSTNFRFWFNGFGDAAYEASINLAVVPQGRILNTQSDAVAGGWVVGEDLDAVGNFTFELTAGTNLRNGNWDAPSYWQIGLVDSAAVPVPAAAAVWDVTSRFVVGLYPRTNTYSARTFIKYQDTGNVSHWWTGVVWSDSLALPDSVLKSEHILKVRIYDDGTNYKADIVDAVTGVSIIANPASIAKSSVREFANGRVLVSAEPYTATFYMGADSDNWILRKYVSSEPVVGTAGAEEEITVDISNTPSSHDFDIVQPSSVYWGNGSEPTWPLEASDCFGNLTNNSSFAVDISAYAGNMTGGNEYALVSGVPGADEFRLTLFKSGESDGDKQDYTTYMDEGNSTPPTSTHYSVAASTITYSELTGNESVWIYEDFGADYFDGDFRFYVDASMDSSSDVDASICIWAMSNNLGDIFSLMDGYLNGLALLMFNDAGDFTVGIYEIDNTESEVFATWSILSFDTTYYFDIYRDESVGNGTLYCDIYDSSAERATQTGIVDDISLTLHTNKKNYQYLYGLNSFNVGESPACSGIISNLIIFPSLTIDGLILTNTAQSWITSLGAGLSQLWGLKFETWSSNSDGDEKTCIITFTAEAS